MADEAAEYWSAFEKETGEKVVARSIGEFYRARDDSSGLWGLLVLTDKSFRFKHMPSENWLSSMFRRADKSRPAAPVEITIPRANILSLHVPARGFFARLLGPAFQRFTITARDAGVAIEAAGEKNYLFSFDPSSGILAALQKAAAELKAE